MKITSSWIFRIASLVWLTSIALLEDVSISSWKTGLLCCVLIGLAWIWRKMPIVVLCCYIALAVCVALVRMEHVRIQEESQVHVISLIDGTEKRIHGVIARDPLKKERTTEIVMKNVSVDGAPYHGRVQFETSQYIPMRLGDYIEASTTLHEPKNSETFDYQTYLATNSIYAVGDRFVPVKVQKSGDMWRITVALARLRESAKRHMQEIVADPHAAYLAGLLLGVRTSLPQTLKDDFQRTGLTHIIAVSGYNITIVGNAINGAVGRFASRKIVLTLTIVGIVLFVVLTGAGASIIRAGIMGSLTLISRHAGRFGNVTNALIASAVLMTIVQPMTLKYDVSFQLSFFATAGLIYVEPKIRSWFAWLPQWMQMRESVTLTMAAQITTLPIILYYFGNLSLISPLANLVVLPVIPLIMLTGSIALAFSYVWAALGKIFALAPWIIMEYQIQIIHLLAEVPYGFIMIPPVSGIAISSYYAVLCGWMFISNKRTHAKRGNSH
jgi:competence protein ComEC